MHPLQSKCPEGVQMVRAVNKSSDHFPCRSIVGWCFKSASTYIYTIQFKHFQQIQSDMQSLSSWGRRCLGGIEVQEPNLTGQITLHYYKKLLGTKGIATRSKDSTSSVGLKIYKAPSRRRNQRPQRSSFCLRMGKREPGLPGHMKMQFHEKQLRLLALPIC